MIIVTLEKYNEKMFVTSWRFTPKSKGALITNITGIRHKFTMDQIPSDFYPNFKHYFVEDGVLRRSYLDETSVTVKT